MKLSRLALLSVAAVAAAAGSVHAETVTYTTLGIFSVPSGPNVVNSGNAVQANGPGIDFIKVEYTGVTNASGPTDVDGAIDFGKISISGRATVGTSTGDLASILNGTAFTLTITQSSPVVTGSNTSTVDATVNVTGHLQVSVVNDTYSFGLDFDQSNPAVIPVPFSLPAFGYIPTDFTLGGTIQSDDTGNRSYSTSQNINGKVEYVPDDSQAPTPVPLPAAAWGGMSLMGLLGGMRAIRRRSISR